METADMEIAPPGAGAEDMPPSDDEGEPLPRVPLPAGGEERSSAAGAPARTVRVGPDRVTHDETTLVVDAARAMEGWVVRRWVRPRVHFAGGEYAIVERRAGTDGRVYYRLEPWPEVTDEPSTEIFYGEHFVRERERTARHRQVLASLRPLAFVLAPPVGFLWSGTKARFEAWSGLEALSATRASLWWEGLIAFLLLVVICIQVWVEAFSGAVLGSPGIHFAAVLVLALDTVLRWDRVFDATIPPPGFYEWLFRRQPPALKAGRGAGDGETPAELPRAPDRVRAEGEEE